MKKLLGNVGVITLLIAPFIIIPAAVIGFGLFLFGIEDLALWICGGASAASLILGPLTFRTIYKWERQTAGSLQRNGTEIIKPWLNLIANVSEYDVNNSQTIEKRKYIRYDFTWPGTFFSGRTNKFVLLINVSTRGCSVRTRSPLTCGEIGPVLIELPNYSIPVRVSKAVVRWARNNEYGLEFIGIDEEDEHRLYRQLMSQMFAAR